MTPATAAAWPFLIARGRRRGYSVLLAPAWLIAEGDHGFLEDTVGPVDPPATWRSAPAVSPHGRRLSLVWAEHAVTAADVGESAAPRDEHSRPLRLLHGVLCASEAVPDPATAGLAGSREAALATYRRFLADEDRFAVEGSAPFQVTIAAGTQRRTPQPEARPAPAAVSSRSSRSSPLSRGRLTVPVLAGVSAVAAVFTTAAILLSGGPDQPPVPLCPPSSQVPSPSSPPPTTAPAKTSPATKVPLSRSSAAKTPSPTSPSTKEPPATGPASTAPDLTETCR